MPGVRIFLRRRFPNDCLGCPSPCPSSPPPRWPTRWLWEEEEEEEDWVLLDCTNTLHVLNARASWEYLQQQKKPLEYEIHCFELFSQPPQLKIGDVELLDQHLHKHRQLHPVLGTPSN